MLVSRKQLVSEFAKHGVNAAPFTLPFELEKTLLEIDDTLSKTRVFKSAEKTIGYADFEDKHDLLSFLKKFLYKNPLFEKWNLSKVECDNGVDVDDPRRGGFNFVSRFSKTDKEHDFIDLDALIRNVVNSCQRESDDL